MSDDPPADDGQRPAVSTDESTNLSTTAVTSSYKILGEFTDATGVGVLGQNNAASGTPIGVRGAVPNASGGYGLYTADDAYLEGVIDTGETDFEVVAGTTTTDDARNVVLGHAFNDAIDGSVGATIAGGGFDDGSSARRNTVSDNYGTVGGGWENLAGSTDGDPTNAEFATVGGGRTNTASGVNSSVGGGKGNEARSEGATVGGGEGNVAHGLNFETVGGGRNNEAYWSYATIAGGHENTANATRTFIGGGWDNTASGNNAIVVAGNHNTASDNFSTVGGGTRNEASGQAAVIPGGTDNTASGDYSFAAGNEANTETSGGSAHHGAFVWGDSTSNAVHSESADQVVFQAGGGMKVYTDSDTSTLTGAELPAGSGSWSSLSASAAKSDVSPVDREAVLAGVEELDVATWEYDAQGGVTHMGPMAEDFHDQFGLGGDEQRISTVDADGVALAAIQELAERLAEKDERIDAQSDRIDDLESRLDTLAENDRAVSADD